MRNSEVSKVLFLPDTIAEKVHSITELANGEWGVFNADNGNVIDMTVATPVIPQNFLVAYMGDGTLGEAGKVYSTSGSHIQLKNMRTSSKQVSASAVPEVVEFKNYNILADGDYGIKLDFRGNTEIYQRFGYNQASKFAVASVNNVNVRNIEAAIQHFEAFMNDSDQFMSLSLGWHGSYIGSTTKALTGTASITTGAAAVTGVGTLFTTELKVGDSIKLGAEVFTVSAIASDTALTVSANASATVAAGTIYVGGISYTAGQISTIATVQAALDALRIGTTGSAAADNPTLEITLVNFSAMYNFCSVNPKYFKQRQIAAIPSLIGADTSWGTADVKTQLVYEKGKGYDIRELEYMTGGHSANPGIYRQSGLHGLPFNIDYIANKDTFYTVWTLSYDQFAVGGWLDYLNQESTYFILPQTPASTSGKPLSALTKIATAAGLTTVVN